MEVVDHSPAVKRRRFLLRLADLPEGSIEASMAFDGVLTPETASFAGQAGLSHSLAYQNTPERRLCPISFSRRLWGNRNGRLRQ